ncbi:hypothetical protein [Knoellia sp. LjRoot47]|uniref:hypothetical protein n=1 Tax=Knoellia sp. LjRoot47 TaxID=3342330 RepID=UPI003ED0AE69
MRMFPFWIQIAWCVGLVVAALTLNGMGSLPWAMAVLGGFVTFGAVIAHLADDLAEQRAGERAETS